MVQIVHSDVEIIRRVLKLLKVPVGNLSVDADNVLVHKSTTQAVAGFASIIQAGLRQSSTVLGATNVTEYAEICQWLEYAVNVLRNKTTTAEKEILQELNNYLESKTYFVSYHLTVADIVLYYYLQPILAQASPHYKAQLLNVCRWLDNVQQDCSIRQNYSIVNFSTNYVLSNVIASH